MVSKKTGAHLKFIDMGSKVTGVEILGDPEKPEHDEFRVCFPGGSVSIMRTSDGSYWIHTLANLPDNSHGERNDDRPIGRVIETRANATGHFFPRTPAELAAVLESTGLYQLSVRIGVRK